jgi:hypothetical protein
MPYFLSKRVLKKRASQTTNCTDRGDVDGEGADVDDDKSCDGQVDKVECELIDHRGELIWSCGSHGKVGECRGEASKDEGHQGEGSSRPDGTDGGDEVEDTIPWGSICEDALQEDHVRDCLSIQVKHVR